MKSLLLPRPRSGPHSSPGRAGRIRGRAHGGRVRPLQARAAPLRMGGALRLLRHGQPRGPQAVEGDGPRRARPATWSTRPAARSAAGRRRGRPLGAARGALHATRAGVAAAAVRARRSPPARRGRRGGVGRPAELGGPQHEPARHCGAAGPEGPRSACRVVARPPTRLRSAAREGADDLTSTSSRASEARRRGSHRRRREVDKAARGARSSR